jgi:hypothetical protein
MHDLDRATFETDRMVTAARTAEARARRTGPEQAC